MAAGDLLTANFQYEFKGLLIGSGTSYVVTKVSGLLGSASYDLSESDIVGDHGMIPGMGVLRKKTIVVEITVDGSYGSDVETKISALQAAFQLPRRTTSRILDQFCYRRNGINKFLWARCEKRDLDSEARTALGTPKVTVQIGCPDPLIYGLTLNTQNIVIATGATNNSAAITNSGDFPDGYQPKLTIVGPATNPIIANTADSNRQVKTTVVLSAIDTLVVDLAKRAVTKNGVEDYSLLASDSQWFSVLPGSNTITYSRSASNVGASSTLTVEWRSVWN